MAEYRDKWSKRLAILNDGRGAELSTSLTLYEHEENLVRQVARELLEYVLRAQKAVTEPPADEPFQASDDDLPPILQGNTPQQAALLAERADYGTD